ncbi:MAG TPA: NifU family protein [bacterium]|nr:NifU family protein [bacterium]
MKEKIEQAVAEIQRTLQSVGANAELLYVSADGSVWLRLKGPCAANYSAQKSFQEDIKHTLRQYVPEIKAIEAVMA